MTRRKVVIDEEHHSLFWADRSEPPLEVAPDFIAALRALLNAKGSPLSFGEISKYAAPEEQARIKANLGDTFRNFRNICKKRNSSLGSVLCKYEGDTRHGHWLNPDLDYEVRP